MKSSSTAFIGFVTCVALAAGTACRKPPTPTAETATATTGAAAAGQSPDAPSPQAPPTPPKPVPEVLPDVLARVNGEPVKKADFDLLISNMETGSPIPAERRDEIYRAALDRLITYTLLQQELKARNITVPDAALDERIKSMQSQFRSEEEFKQALASRQMSLERLREDARVDLCIEKMMEAEVADTQPASDAEIGEFYEKNPERFTRPEAVRASHILIKVDQNAPETDKKKARAEIDGILKRVRDGEDFATLAKAHSHDGSAQQGGDLNYFERGQMVPPFEQAAFALQPGQVSDVVTTQFGYHIIKLMDRRQPETVPLAQVSERLRQVLTGQKKQARADAFIDSLKQKSKIEVLI